MREEQEKRAAEAVDIARKAGAQEATATVVRVRKVGFRMRNGLLEEAKESTSRVLEVRLYVDGRYSAHWTTDMRPAEMRGFVTEAVAMTRALQPDPHRRLPDPALYPGQPQETGTLDIFDARVPALERDQRLAWCGGMNSRVTGKEDVIAAESEVEDRHYVTTLATSNGFTGTYESTLVGIYTSVTLEDGDRRPEEDMTAFVRHVEDMPQAGPFAEDVLARAQARLGSKQGPTVRTAMVVDNQAGARLLFRLLGPAWGGSVQQERSFWRERMGKRVLSEHLTVTDDPLLRRGLDTRPFDDEGIAARPLPLIENGVLRNLYLDTYYASKLAMAPTTGSPSNRIVTPGARGRDALVAEVGSGVYVTSWLGGNIDATSGDFSFGVRGHLIENGAIGAPIGEMNVTGNLVDLFANLVEVGNDPWIYSSARVPTLVFEGVQFSGA